MIGYACLTKGITSIRGFKTCTVKTYSESKISEIIDNNLDVLLDILKYNIANNIYMFRISYDIIPLLLALHLDHSPMPPHKLHCTA